MTNIRKLAEFIIQTGDPYGVLESLKGALQMMPNKMDLPENAHTQIKSIDEVA